MFFHIYAKYFQTVGNLKYATENNIDQWQPLKAFGKIRIFPRKVRCLQLGCNDDKPTLNFRVCAQAFKKVSENKSLVPIPYLALQ